MSANEPIKRATRINMESFRKKLGRILFEVQEQDKRFLVIRHGKQQGAVVSLQDLLKLQVLDSTPNLQKQVEALITKE